MESFARIVVVGCILGFGTFVHGEGHNTSTYHLAIRGATCNHQIRVIFTSDRWTTEMGRNTLPRDLLQDEFLLGIMDQIVISAKESGIQCIFDKFAYVLTCCDLEHLEKHRPLPKKELTPSEKFWGFDFSHTNFIFLILNLFFFVFITGWGFVLALKCSDAVVAMGRTDSTET